jgi:hypothetical protein
MLGKEFHGQIVLLLGQDAIGWDDLPLMQELAMLAVAGDVPVEVVTPDPFAASIATAAGIPVITEARLSDEVGMAETLLSRATAGQLRRRRFAFGSEPPQAEVIGEAEAEASRTD